ncbi:MAG TPA: amidohydrolase family protein, partial [Chthoniobacterales bacterium]
MILANAILVLAERLVPQGWISFSSEGIILDLGQGTPPPDPITIDVRNHYLAPGFVDLHIHGAMGRDTMEATHEAFAAIAEFHASGGTTSLALTTLSAPEQEVLAVLDAARSFTNTHAGAQVLGIHLEGVYFSPEKPGAHDPSILHSPTDLAELDRLLAYSDVITQMTLAPELPGALPLIERLSTAGIIPSGGHSDCWAEEAEAARAHGMTQVTHTYNCMSSARRRGAFREAGLL